MVEILKLEKLDFNCAVIGIKCVIVLVLTTKIKKPQKKKELIVN